MTTNNEIFGLALSVLAFGIALIIQKKINKVWANPLLLAVAMIIAVLLLFRIPLQDYRQGAHFIALFIAPATAALSVNIYKQWPLLKANLIPVLGGTLCGSLVTVLSAKYLSRAFGLSEQMMISILPKSTTTAIAMPLSEAYNGVVSITVLALMITGLLGAIIGPLLVKWLRISAIPAGIALGTASHALGTAEALKMGEIEGAMSGLALALAGVFTVLWMALLF